jgi:cytoskeleton protein RodZ
MSDQADPSVTAGVRPTTAGGLLRQARQAQGLHIAALAASIKVVPRKLELLESDQFDQLPDATFTRALAHTVCRTLKIDPAPVLALLPPLGGYRIQRVGEGLNRPYRESQGRLTPKEGSSIALPTLWVVAAIVVATAIVYLMPAGWLPFLKPAASGSPAQSSTAIAPQVESKTAAEPQTAASAAAPAVEEASGVDAVAEPQVQDAAPVAASSILEMHTTAPSWIEVTDAHGQSLIARTVGAGESVSLNGAMPFKVRIGNALATQVMFRGQPFELASFTRDNVARLELK